MRDEAYYQEEKDSLSKPEDEKSLKSQINAARKDENVSVEEQIDTYMSSRVAAGEMSEQQGNEVGNLIKHELDGRDGNQDGKVDDEELSRRDVRRGLKEVDKTHERKCRRSPFGRKSAKRCRNRHRASGNLQRGCKRC